ncbi:MAG: cytochrome b/b6 domain-containing protein [Anaerolineales bacterium]|nr:cytochrome b/b6 domain-containing protein [Anaerolineales bacterium]
MSSATVPRSAGKRRLSETLKNYWLDILLFFAFIIDMNTRFTGLPIHEWLGIAFAVALIYHLMLHWQWICAVTRRLLSRLPNQQRLRYLIDVALFIVMVIVVVTGLWISEVALLQLGIAGDNSRIWRQLHHTSSDLVIFLVALHLALDWKWIIASTKRYVLYPIKRLVRREGAPA